MKYTVETPLWSNLQYAAFCDALKKSLKAVKRIIYQDFLAKNIAPLLELQLYICEWKRIQIVMNNPWRMK